MKFWQNKQKDEIKDIQTKLLEFDAKLNNLLQEIKEKGKNSPDIPLRIADLEVKMAKLWGLLLETTPNGREKLSRFGKVFGGKASKL